MHRTVEIFQWKEQVVDKESGYALSNEEVAFMSPENRENLLLLEYKGVWAEEYLDGAKYSVPWFTNKGCE
jgi:hypothetical protein